MHLNGPQQSIRRFLKTSVKKYICRTIASFSELIPPITPSTASVKAKPSRTTEVIFLDEDTLVGENVLDNDDSSKEVDKKKKDSGNSVIVVVVKRAVMEKKMMMIKTKERIRRKA